MSFFSQFSPEQLRRGYRRNAIGLSQMVGKAERTGRKVNGYTAAELRASFAVYDGLGRASDEAIRAHIANVCGNLKSGAEKGGTK